MFCRPILHTIVLSLALAGGTTLLGAVEDRPGVGLQQQYHLNHWTAEDGLPQNRITALAQTRDGYIWIATWFGLARFDGARFTVFNEINTPAMVSQTINALTVDTEGSLWVGTADGLLRYRDRQFTRIALGEGLPNPKVWRLWPNRSGGVWVQVSEPGDDKFLLWLEGRVVVVATLDLGEDQSVWSLRESEEGSLTVTTSHGLKEITRQGEVRAQPVPAGAPAFPWGGVWRQKDSQHWWISATRDLWLWHNETWQPMQRGNSHSDRNHFIYEDRSGRLWVNRGEAGGFWASAGDSVEAVKLGEYGAEKSVECMLEDAEGHTWFGTAHGLFQLKPTLIRALTTADGLPHNECWSVSEAPDGAVWVETAGGVARIQNERAQIFSDEPQRARRQSILADFGGNVWLGNGHDGLITWRPGQETNAYWSNGEWGKPTGVTLDSLYRDRHGDMWVGTDRGATWFAHGQPAADWGEFGLPTNSVRSTYQTRDGAMWFGIWKGGAVRWKRNADSSPLHRSAPGKSRNEVRGPVLAAVTRFTTTNGLADDRVFVFHEDADGVLWIGTHNGLSRVTFSQPSSLNPQPHFFTFRTEHGLPDNLINWLEEDDFGRLWFSCNRGIFRIDRSELNAVAEGRKTRANVAVYGTADGMPSPETNGEFQPAGCKARDGRLWFPTQLGVVVIDPHAARASEATEVQSPVVIEQVVADGEIIFGDGAAMDVGNWTQGDDIKPHLLTSAARQLGPGRAKVLRIGYTANSFTDPKRVRFRYRLGGRDADWREATHERVAYYADLKPGRYQFEVKAANPHGIWNESPAAFAFSLAPHIYETWPFYGLCAAGVIGLAAGVQAYRLRWQHRLLKLEQQRALANERTRIARDLHDDLGTALTGLALELDVIGREAKASPPVADHLGESAQRTRELAERMREVVWTVNPQCDTLSSLASFLEQQVSQFLRVTDVRVRLDFPEDIPAVPLAADARHQLALSVREALTNVVRHAQASEVVVSLAIVSQTLIVQVKDNGRGFQSPVPNGHGLENMRTRLLQIGGGFDCVSTPSSGTVVKFRLPLKQTVPAKAFSP